MRKLMIALLGLSLLSTPMMFGAKPKPSGRPKTRKAPPKPPSPSGKAPQQNTPK